MTHHTLKALLLEVNHLIDVQKRLSTRTGDNFNIFKILGVESREVQTHSSFLRELLDPRGAHGMGSVFLNLFLQNLTPELQRFESASARVTSERFIGIINNDYTRGGRIDLFLEDKNKRRIFIENKIYAKDQKNQLLRYHQFDQSACLIYLTLFDKELGPKSDSTQNIPIIYLSYANHILRWLEDCRKEAVLHPTVREALTQYIELIRHLTNQTTRDAMKEEIELLLVKNPEYIDAINAATDTLNAIKNKSRTLFFEAFKSEFSTTPLLLSGGLTIRFEFNEDGEGFYIGYKLFEKDKDISDSPLAEKYFDKLCEINSTFHKRPKGWLGWYWPAFFAGKQFKHLDSKIILRLFSEEAFRKETVSEIINEDSEIRKAFLEWQAKDSGE